MKEYHSLEHLESWHIHSVFYVTFNENMEKHSEIPERIILLARFTAIKRTICASGDIKHPEWEITQHFLSSSLESIACHKVCWSRSRSIPAWSTDDHDCSFNVSRIDALQLARHQSVCQSNTSICHPFNAINVFFFIFWSGILWMSSNIGNGSADQALMFSLRHRINKPHSSVTISHSPTVTGASEGTACWHKIQRWFRVSEEINELAFFL